jgi:hypothetical protein
MRAVCAQFPVLADLDAPGADFTNTTIERLSDRHGRLISSIF